VAWAESLKDFSIYADDLPRVMITTDDFKFWYEDKDYISVEKLFALAEKPI